jgi:hypothetical protein
MAALFSRPSAPEIVQVPAPTTPSVTPTTPPTPTSASVQAAGQTAAAAAGSGAGQASTILTSGLGVLGAPPTTKRQLLGA